MTSIPDPNRNETTRTRDDPRLPDGDIIDLRGMGLSGYRVLLDEFLKSVDGIGGDEAFSVGAEENELGRYQREVLALLSKVVSEDGRRPSRRQARAFAIRILGHLQVKASLPHLTSVLDNPYEPATQRAAAADAIGMIGDSAMGEVLRRHLDDPNPTVRRTIALAVGAIAPLGAAEWLRSRLDQESDPAVRPSLSSAVESLGSQAEKAAVETSTPDEGESPYETRPWPGPPATS